MSWTYNLRQRLRRIAAAVLRWRRDGYRPRLSPLVLLRRAAISLLVLMVIGFSVLSYYAYSLPISDNFGKPERRASTTLVAADGEVFAMRGRFSAEILDLNELPDHLVKAVISIEDRRFYQHIGIDFIGMARAAVVNVLAGEVRQGGSTITQQLAKVTFLSSERTFKRKIQEMMIALWLENRLTKDEILVRYLNKVYLGAGAYGVDGAAQRYFNKSAKSLTLAESAMLAGLIRAPSHLAPTRNLEAARVRANRVLKAMIDAGHIDKATADAAPVQNVKLAVNPNTHTSRSGRYFADWVAKRTNRILGPLTADLTVETTLNHSLQTLAENTLEHWLKNSGDSRNVSQGGMIVMSHDGAILAMVGGRNYDESEFNRATQARRQPGSLFKLFVYLAAFDAGLTPDSEMVDQPIEIDKWSPQNYYGTHRGEVSLRTAFAESINSVAVQLSEQVGRGRVIGVAKSLGIRSPIKSHPSLALGASEVTLLEMTAAYAAMAADAKVVRPYGIKTLRGTGRRLYRHRLPSRAPAALPWKREEMLDLLITTVDSGTGKAARLHAPIAGKTGTTQDYRDAWFIGFTADIVVGVWLGNDDNSPTDRVTGGDLPAKIWRDFVSAAYRLEGAMPKKKELLANVAPPPVPTPAKPGSTEKSKDSTYNRLRNWFRSIVE